MNQCGIEWYQSLGKDHTFLTEEAKIGFAVSLERQMEQERVSQADLARRMRKTPAYISKVLRGDANLTIKTMVGLVSAVNGTLHLHVAQNHADVRWTEVLSFPETTQSDEDAMSAVIWADFTRKTLNDERISATA